MITTAIPGDPMDTHKKFEFSLTAVVGFAIVASICGTFWIITLMRIPTQRRACAAGLFSLKEDPKSQDPGRSTKARRKPRFFYYLFWREIVWNAPGLSIFEQQ
jgi:hypothetical protein